MRFLSFLLIAALSFAGASVMAQDAPRLAKIVAVDASDGTVTRQFFGRVAARETVDLAFQVGGQVLEFPPREGQAIPEGSLIAQLDQEPFELALAQARTRAEQADRTVARLERLQGSAVSEVTVDDAQTEAELAAIAVRDAERALRQATLRAPFDGLIAARNVAPFSTVAAGTPVVRLHDMSELRIDIDVPEIVFQSAGEDPDIALSARFPAIAGEFPLGVREFNAETSTIGQTFRITLGMAPPEGRVILPGSSVTVTAVLNRGEARMTVPQAAIVAANDGSPQVMVFAPTGAAEGSVRAVPVKIMPSNTGTVVVLSGLEQGQEIVASGGSLLEDGDTVRRFTGFGN